MGKASWVGSHTRGADAQYLVDSRTLEEDVQLVEGEAGGGFARLSIARNQRLHLVL